MRETSVRFIWDGLHRRHAVLGAAGEDAVQIVTIRFNMNVPVEGAK